MFPENFLPKTTTTTSSFTFSFCVIKTFPELLQVRHGPKGRTFTDWNSRFFRRISTLPVTQTSASKWWRKLQKGLKINYWSLEEYIVSFRLQYWNLKINTSKWWRELQKGLKINTEVWKTLCILPDSSNWFLIPFEVLFTTLKYWFLDFNTGVWKTLCIFRLRKGNNRKRTVKEEPASVRAVSRCAELYGRQNDPGHWSGNSSPATVACRQQTQWSSCTHQSRTFLVLDKRYTSRHNSTSWITCLLIITA